ncbi:MAG: dihydroorotase [Lachnospiraceae bacterium]|nr:dihydroorotase [Lachnospiraceae bacterium]
MILIKGGRVMDPATNLDEEKDIVIDDKGKITGIYEPEEVQRNHYETVIDAAGEIVAPGFVDVHVHFRDPGLTHKEDIVTGSAAAAAGGYTTVICMANTKPPVDDVDIYKELQAREDKLPIHVLQTANVTKGMKGEELTSMEELHLAGVKGFTDDGVPIENAGLMREALKKCKELDVPISLHEEDGKLMYSQGVNKGTVSEQLGLPGAPDEAEYTLVARDLMLNKKIGAKLNIQHISSAVTVDLIRKAKKDGIRVYGEVTPQHLSATEDLVLEQGALARVNPPLRTEKDRQALLQGLKDGVIDMIATDHAPHSKEEKERGIAKAPSGMIGLETAFGLLMTYGVKEYGIPLMTVLRALTVNPAELYKLDAGKIYVGGPGDLVIFDPNREWVVSDAFVSKSTNSPFIGRKLCGKVTKTICNGKIVFTK